MKTLRIIAAALVSWGLCTPALCADAPLAERLYAAKVPGGALRVLVVARASAWPAGGVRVEDESGTEIGRLRPDTQAYAELDSVARQGVDALGRAALAPTSAATVDAIVALRLMSDWSYARAAGAGGELPGGTSARRIRVTLLDRGGLALRTIGPVDVVAPDAGPGAPREPRAQARAEGVQLSWRLPEAGAVPAFAFQVVRDFAGQRENLSPGARPLSATRTGGTPSFLDAAPPVETDARYELRIVDVLGIAGAPASVAVHIPDLSAGRPPAEQSAHSEDASVRLRWKPPGNPLTRGIVVERAQLVGGPYEILTPEGLRPQDDGYVDRDLIAGGSYYYRVRSVMPDGSLGPAGTSLQARPRLARPLAAPANVRAAAGVSEVLLQWDGVDGVAVAGYNVERRDPAGNGPWSRLNARLVPATQYVDAIGAGAGGEFEYRISAYATDETAGTPSAVLRVALRDTSLPPPPVIIAAKGEEGRVRIEFRPAEPLVKTATVALVRSASEQEDGLVVGAPVPAGAGAIEDEWVQAGRSYWYRLVAFDAAGMRSLESQYVKVHVGAPRLPQPARPSVQITTADGRTQAQIRFAAPPPHAGVLVQVQRPDGRWRQITGPIDATSAVDPDPSGPQAQYRIVFIGDSGGAGPPSEAAQAIGP